MSEVFNLSDDLVVISDLVPLDGRISWAPPGARGFEPNNKFLVTSPEHALLLDTGVAAHGESLLEALAALLGPRRLVILTTRNELDCIGNLGILLDRYPDAQVLTTNALPVVGLVHLKTAIADRIAVGRVGHGENLARFGFPRLRVVTPVIRVLGTGWLIDDETDTLFPSDFFAADLLSEAGEDIVRRDAVGLAEPDALLESILAKFDWLANADIEPLLRTWDRFFAASRFAAIAPSHGRITVGSEIVARVVARYRAAIASANARTRRSAVDAE